MSFSCLLTNFLFILFFSPSNSRLTSPETMKVYLQTEGTCKCGLECPLLVDKVFNFSPYVSSKEWTASSNEVMCNDDLTKLCNHKRKIIAMATLQSSASLSQTITETSSLNKMADKRGGKKGRCTEVFYSGKNREGSFSSWIIIPPNLK